MSPKRITLTGLILMAATSYAISEDPVEILDRMEYNMRGDASYTEMSMETVRPRYTREISMRSWSLGDDFAMIYVTAPAREEGTAFLKRGNEMWNFQPRIDRTVKMPPSMMSQSWMGSDFTNEDLVSGTSTVEDYDHTFLGTETIDDHECYKIELIPHPENPIVYEKVIYYVSREYYLPVRIENYDEYDDLVNTIHFREISEFDGRDFPAVMEMVPEDEDDRKTVITTHDADFGIDIGSDFFTIENLTEIR